MFYVTLFYVIYILYVFMYDDLIFVDTIITLHVTLHVWCNRILEIYDGTLNTLRPILYLKTFETKIFLCVVKVKGNFLFHSLLIYKNI